VAQAVDRYLSKGTITQDTYDTFVDHLVRDLARYGRKENLSRQIVKRIIDIFPYHTSWNTLKEGTEIKDYKTALKYVESLSETFTVTYLYELALDGAWPDYDKEKKIYIRDPFIFHALRSWVYRQDPFELSREFLQSPINSRRLVECVVGDHLSRLAFMLHPTSRFKPPDYVFYWTNKKGQEVDFTVQVDDKFLPLKAKWEDRIERDDTRGVCNFIRDARSHDFGIITSKNSLRVEEKYIVVPLGILLLLI
jgi:predicted AAA+ superfamily ATPase